MPDQDELIRFVASVLDSRPDPGLLDRICAQARGVLGMDGVVVSLLSPPEHRLLVCASDEAVAVFQDLQFITGDGPVIDAHREGRVVMSPDLSRALTTWPLLAQATTGTPAYYGIYAFPLSQTGEQPLGVLGAYRRAPTAGLNAAQVSDAQVVAQAVTAAILRTRDPTEPHRAHADAERAKQHDGQDGDAAVEDLSSMSPLSRWSAERQVVFHAVGFVVAQLRLHPEAALARLRAHAFVTDQPLLDVAVAVVERRLLINP